MLNNRVLIPGWMIQKAVDGPWLVIGTPGGAFQSLYFPIDPEASDAGLSAYRGDARPGSFGMFLMDFAKSDERRAFREQYPGGDDIDLLAQIILHYQRNI